MVSYVSSQGVIGQQVARASIVIERLLQLLGASGHRDIGLPSPVIDMRRAEMDRRRTNFDRHDEAHTHFLGIAGVRTLMRGMPFLDRMVLTKIMTFLLPEPTVENAPPAENATPIEDAPGNPSPVEAIRPAMDFDLFFAVHPNALEASTPSSAASASGLGAENYEAELRRLHTQARESIEKS